MFGTWINVKIDDELVTSALSEPERPSMPGTTVPNAVGLSPQNLEVDGENVVCEKYNIGGSNFFQLRELGTLLGFEVDYDISTDTAIIRSAQN